MARVRRFRLKNVEPSEVSLVRNPAFRESAWLILKSMAVKHDGLALTGKPRHEWLAIENVDDDDLTLLCTAVVLAPGDPKPDGGKFTKEEVAALERLWAARHGSTNRDGRYSQQTIYEGGQRNGNVTVVGYGVAPDKPLSLQGAGDKLVPPNSWFVQLLIDDATATGTVYGPRTGHTASRVVGNRAVVNGVKVLNPAILMKGDVGDDGWPEPPEGFVLTSSTEGPITAAGLGAELGRAAREAIEEAANPVEEVDAATFGRQLGEAAAGVQKADPAALGKELGEAAVEALVEDDH